MQEISKTREVIVERAFVIISRAKYRMKSFYLLP